MGGEILSSVVTGNRIVASGWLEGSVVVDVTLERDAS